MPTKILIKRGSASQWSSSTTALSSGELGLDTTNNIIKVGDGSTLWNSLPGLTLTLTQVSELAQDALSTAFSNGTHSNITVTYDDNANSISLATGPDVITTTSLNNTLTDPSSGYLQIADLSNKTGSGVAELVDGDLYIPSGNIIFEGTTDNSYELTLSSTDVTSDITLNLPNSNGTLALTSDVTTAVANIVNSAPATLDTLNELATALGNDANFSTTVTNSIADKVSKSGGDTITAATASTVGLIIKGAASQTANLQEWQDSAGTVLASISPVISSTVTLKFTESYYWNINWGSRNIFSTTSGNLVVTPYDDSRKVLVVKGYGAQTANLTEWQNSSGTTLAYIDKDGQILTPRVNLPANGLIVEGGTGPYIQMGSSATYLYTRSASNKGLIIQGAASQTADLQQWQNSNGTVLLSVSADGTLNKTGTLNIGPVLQFANPGVGNETKFNFQKTNDSAYLIVKEKAADQTYYEFGMWDNALDSQDYFQWFMGQWSGWAGYGWMPLQLGSNTSPNGTKSQTLRFTGEQSVFWSPILTGSNTPYYTTNPNYQTHQDFEVTKGWAYTSNSTNIPRVNASGGATLNIDLSGYTYASRMGYRLTVDAGGTTFSYTTYGGDNSSGSAIAITGGWQTLSNGTKIKINGTAAANDDWQFLAFPTPRVAFGGSTDTTSLVTIKPSASDKGLIIKAAVSPTNNIQEWQDSSGAVKVSINNSFNATFHNGAAVYGNYGNVAALVVETTAASLPAIVTKAASSQTANLQEWQNSSGTTISSIGPYGNAGFGGSPSLNTYLFAKALDPANVGTIVRGAASQTANLQEWQDSSGSIMSKISSSGDIYAVSRSVLARFVQADNGAGAYIDLGFNNANSVSIVGRTSTTAPQLIIKGIASQSANLQEWQNSSGTVLVKLTAEGVLDTPLITNAQAASYTLVAADSGKLVEINNASGVTLTIPTNASVSYAIGTQINILQTGTGQITIAGAGGVTVNATPGLKLRAQWSSATLIKRGTDTWVAIGDLSV